MAEDAMTAEAAREGEEGGDDLDGTSNPIGPAADEAEGMAEE